MEEQAKGLAELCASDEEQLKELYDSLNDEDRRDKEELEYLREQQRRINRMLDCLNIPRIGETSMLSVSERVELALKKKEVA